ncbi:unnamed protein product [Rhodiola kirilowii]
MTKPRNPSSTSSSSSDSSTGRKVEVPIISKEGNGGANFSGHRTTRYPNPPDALNPDAATLREQWRYAIRLYSKWYSHAWGTAILAGVSFFALGWIIKGENPIHTLKGPSSKEDNLSVKCSTRALPSYTKLPLCIWLPSGRDRVLVNFRDGWFMNGKASRFKPASISLLISHSEISVNQLCDHETNCSETNSSGNLSAPRVNKTTYDMPVFAASGSVVGASSEQLLPYESTLVRSP